MDEELYHHGIKGMKWGIRRTQAQLGHKTKKKETDGKNHSSELKSIKKEKKSSYSSEKGPKKFNVINASNSAARTFYKKDRTNSFKNYRKYDQKLSKKEARLTEEQIKNGRYRVARFRSTTLRAIHGSAAVASGALLLTPGPQQIAGIAGLLTTPASYIITGGHYYSSNKNAYGKDRAKYQSREEIKRK